MSAPSLSNPQHQPPLRCGCCKNLIISEDKDHAQNNPCGHIVCIPCVLKANMKWLANPALCQVRDCTQKFITSCQYFNRGIPGEIIEIEKIAELGTDEVAWILSFLPLEKIMCLRRVNMAWREAAKKTIVPLTDFRVDSERRYNAMRVMTTELPNLQQVTLLKFGFRNKYNDGEDPDRELAAETANYTSHDINIISNFRKLRVLKITDAYLNGRYPVLFNSFPLLQKLGIKWCSNLKWDLDMLAAFPLLKEFDSDHNSGLTGNINSLRVLKDTLEMVRIVDCENVEGNFMDLADFLQLKKLDLEETDVTGTAVTGDIRDIGVNDFLSLESLTLPEGVYGGEGYELERIADAPDLVRAVYLLKKQRPALEMSWFAELSDDSPDWYEAVDEKDTPPFFISFVKAGSRLGYRWETVEVKPCEVNWLDPEPESDSREYEDYVSDYERIQGEVGLYRGYYEPPTEEQYTLLYEEHVRIQRDDEDY